MVCLFAHPHTQVVALGGHISWPSAARVGKGVRSRKVEHCL